MKCKSKSQWDYQFILIRMAITKMTKNNKCWQVCVEKTILIHCRWLRKLVYPYGKQEISQKMLNRTTTGSSNSTTGYLPEGNKNANLKRYLKAWHPTPVLLPGQAHGWKSLVGWSPWGCWGSDTNEWLHFHFSLSCIGEGNGNPLQCSCLENPRDGRAWWAAVYGRVAESDTTEVT